MSVPEIDVNANEIDEGGDEVWITNCVAYYVRHRPPKLSSSRAHPKETCKFDKATIKQA